MSLPLGCNARLRYAFGMGNRPATSTPTRPGSLVDRALFAHPRTVGESYFEHLGIAGRFGATMVTGGLKCMIHAVLPSVFERAASDCVAGLNRELTRRRAASTHVDPDYVI